MTVSSSDASRRRIRTFGRVGGRALSARQQSLLDDLLPRLAIRIPDAGPIALDAAFPASKAVWLEIGFGGGEHLVEQARRHSDTGFIGCEPFNEGMAKALTAIDADGLSNIRLWHEDARDLIAALPDKSLDRVFILFPDPWPRKKHHKRRLIQPDFLQDLHRVCRACCRVRFATDVASYADEALGHFLAHGGFVWQARAADDWRRAPADHVTTRYEVKKLGDCAPVWFDFEVR